MSPKRWDFTTKGSATMIKLNWILVMALPIVLIGCAGDGTGEIERTPELRGGKADYELYGSCVDSCGYQASDGNCYCDDQCVSYDDCCIDFVAECDPEPEPELCCDPDEYPEFPFEPTECCSDGNWQVTGSSDPCGNLGLEPGTVCEPEPICCDPAENPGGIEGSHCCADGTWRMDTGSVGSEECILHGGDGEVCSD